MNVRVLNQQIARYVCRCLKLNITKRCKDAWKADSRKNFVFFIKCLIANKYLGLCFPIGHIPAIPSREDTKVEAYSYKAQSSTTNNEN